jgi:hypothetical protein
MPHLGPVIATAFTSGHATAHLSTAISVKNYLCLRFDRFLNILLLSTTAALIKVHTPGVCLYLDGN